MSARRKGRVLMAIGVAVLAALACAVAVTLLMAARAASPAPRPAGESPPAEGVGDREASVDWEYWQTVNPDVAAWVQIPGTEVSQPVVQAPKSDPLRYLTHDVYGEWNLFGCPYIDAGCPQGADSWNVVISGHNISTPPAMFHELERYHDPVFAREHSEVLLHTPQGTRKLSVVGSKTMAGWEALKRVSFSSPDDYRAYREQVMGELDVRVRNAGPYGRMVMLCTCSYYSNPANERTLVIAQQK